MPRTTLTPAARKARTALCTSRVAFGAAVLASLAGNVIASPKNPIAIGVALWIPFAFLITMMMIENVPAKGRLGVLRKVGVGAIAGIAGWASFWHLHEVCVMAGMDTVTSYLLPLTVDVVIAFASPGIRRKATPVPSSRRKPQVKTETTRKLKAV